MVREVKADIYVFKAGTATVPSELCVLYCNDGILERGKWMAKEKKKEVKIQTQREMTEGSTDMKKEGSPDAGAL